MSRGGSCPQNSAPGPVRAGGASWYRREKGRMDMIRLVASDVDGTLLQNGERALSPELFRQIRRLREKGILFCPASGRQYHSLQGLFAPVAEELAYVCENGGVVYGPGSPGEVLDKTVMERSAAEALSRDILALPGCELLISGENMSYVIPKQTDMAALMGEGTGNRVSVLSAPEDTPEDIVKVSAYCPAGTGAIPAWLARKWGRFHPAVAGAAWLDFMEADKGTGLAGLCRALGIALGEVMAFGDNCNDLPMLRSVGQPWIMESAAADLRRRFPRRCGRVEEILKLL